MILVRNVFQAKYGRGGELVTLLKEARQMGLGRPDDRILTDASGSFFTVVFETVAESLAAWEQRQTEDFSRPEFNKWFARTIPLIESGVREFYTLERVS